MRKTGVFTRLLTVLLMAAMVLPMLPLAGIAEGEDQFGYLFIADQAKKDRTVFLRPAPGSSDYLDKLDEYTVVQILAEKVSAGNAWYQVKNPENGETGYIMASFVQLMTAEEQANWQLSPNALFAYEEKYVLATPVPTQIPGMALGYIRLIENDVNLRREPAGAVINENDQMPLGLVLPYYSETAALVEGHRWAQVVYNGLVGYVRSDCYMKSDVAGNPVSPEGSTPVPETVIGYVKLILDKVLLRETPGGNVLNLNDRMPLGLIMSYTEGPVPHGGKDWVKTTYHGQTGYVRSDCFEYCDEFGGALTTTPTAAPAVTPTGSTIYGEGTFGRTVMNQVMFRKEMNLNGDYWARLPENWLVQVLGSETKNGILWYKVQSGTPTNPTRTCTGYIHSGYLALVAGGATATPAVPQTGNYAQVIINGINVRQTPGGVAMTALMYGTVVNVITAPVGSSANDWYYIEYNNIYGYVEATALRKLSGSELDYVTLPPTPVPAPTPTPTPAYTGTGYIKTILDKVNIRKTPAGTVLTPTDNKRIPLGTVISYFEGPTKTSETIEWVKVTYNGITGYVRSDCYVYCDAAGVVPNPTAVPVPSQSPDVTGQKYIRLIKSGVNVRTGPWGTSLGQLSKGTVLPYFSTKLNGTSEMWYEVYSTKLGQYGYVLSTMAVPCDANGNDLPDVPAVTPTPGASYTGYIATVMSSVWVRSGTYVDAATVGKIAAKGTVLPVTGAAIQNPAINNYTWYPVQLGDGTRGYVRGDMVFELAQWQLDYYNQHGVCPTPTPGPATPPPGNSDYIITIGDKLWIRQSPSTKAGTYGQLALGTVLKYEGKETSGQINWYQIIYNGKVAYLHGDYVRILTNAEYYAWLATQPTPTPSPTPTALPDPSTLSDLGLTTDERVKIRQTPSMNGKEIGMVYTTGTTVTYLGQYQAPAADNNYYWFKIKASGVTGWMRGDFVRILTQEEKRLYQLTGDPDAPQEATYRTLKKGDSGEDVRKLQEKLVEKGYLAASEVSGTYLTSTEQAVIAFQKAYGLTMDGIAGEKTQHALFNTVPEGTYDGSSVTPTLYPVEKIDWFRGGIQSIWRNGTVAIVTDVYTGISFKAQRLYGDNHADCEPQTTSDTAAICQIFGVSSAQEIEDRQNELQSWRRRPLWVTIGGRTFAASMYGIPHNYDGDRIPDNNYRGQFCIHFTNSMTHGSGNLPPQVDPDASYNAYFGHQSAIEYAYTHSQSGNK